MAKACHDQTQITVIKSLEKNNKLKINNLSIENSQQIKNILKMINYDAVKIIQKSKLEPTSMVVTAVPKSKTDLPGSISVLNCARYIETIKYIETNPAPKTQSRKYPKLDLS